MFQQKRERFESRFSDIDKTKNDMVNMTLQVSLDSIKQDNKHILHVFHGVHEFLHECESERSSKLEENKHLL